MEIEEELEEILQALVHQARRRIIKSLAEKGPQGFADFKEETGIEGSGTFAFHLRKLQGLVEKSEDGKYRLTEKGWKAYAMLKAYQEPGLLPTKHQEEESEGKLSLLVIEDRASLHLTEDTIRRALEEGMKVLVRDVAQVIVHPMGKELLRRGLEAIEDVAVVREPKDLLGGSRG